MVSQPCRYCGDEYDRTGLKQHERYCDERSEEMQGTAPGLEFIPGEQARLGAALEGRKQELEPDERRRFHGYVSQSRVER